MIKILKKKDKKFKKKKPAHYLLKFNYMIGDANGNTSEEVEISKDNPFLERFVKLLKSLKPNKGCWGIALSEEDMEVAQKEKQITKDDLNFLKKMMFDYFENDSTFEISEEDEKNGYDGEFLDGVVSEIDGSFLVFEDVDLYYIDEFGEKFETKIK